MKRSSFKTVLAAGLLAASTSAMAEVKIQNAEYVAPKGVVFVKGKADDATTLYVINAQTNQTITTISATRGQFKKNIDIAEGNVPCTIKVQTNNPSALSGGWSWGGAVTSTSSGESDTSSVRHAPNDCQ